MTYTIVDPPKGTKGKFEVVEQPGLNKISRALNIGAGSAASGIWGTPGALESYLRTPSVLSGKGMRFFGKEPPEILQQQENIIPSPEDVYNHLERIIPENMLERYLKTIISSASVGATIGGTAGGIGGAGVGALPGAAAGAGAGAVFGTIAQSLDELGVPPEVMEILSIAVPILIPFANSVKNKLSTEKKATSLIKESIEKAGKGEPPSPPGSGAFDDATALKSELQKSQQQTPIPENIPGIPKNIGLGKNLTEENPLEGRIKVDEKPGAPKISYQFKLPEPQQEAVSLKGRAQPHGERLKRTSPELENKIYPVGQRVSPHKFYNDYQAGDTLSQNAKIAWDAERNQNKLLYEIAGKEIQGVESPHNELILQLQAARDKFTTKRPNPAEKLVVDEIDSLLDVLRDKESGHAKAVTADSLMKTANSLSYRVNYEDLHSGPKDILRSVVHDINNSAIQAVEYAGKDANSIRIADKAFAKTAEKFTNDEIAPFLKSKITNQEDLLSMAKKPQVYRALKEALSEFPSGRSSIAKLERSIVEDKMSGYIEDPAKVGSLEFEQDLRNLEPIIGKDRFDLLKSTMESKKEQIKEPRGKLEEGRVSYKERPEKMALFEEKRPKQFEKESAKAIEEEAARKFQEKQISVIEKHAEKVVSKYTGKTPKEIEAIFKQKEGPEELRALKKVIEKNPSLQQYYYRLAAKRIHEVFYEGKIEGKLKAQDVYEIMNKRENYSQIEELLGKEEAKTLFNNLKKNKDTQATMINIAKWSGAPLLIKAVNAWLKAIPGSLG